MFFEFQISFFEKNQKTQKTHEFTGFFKKPGLNWVFSKIWVFYKPCHARACTRKHAAEIAEKRSSDADDAQQQEGHNFTVIHIHAHKSAAKINEVAVPRR